MFFTQIAVTGASLNGVESEQMLPLPLIINSPEEELETENVNKIANILFYFNTIVSLSNYSTLPQSILSLFRMVVMKLIQQRIYKGLLLFPSQTK